MHKRLTLGYTRAKTEDFKGAGVIHEGGYTRGGYTYCNPRV